jgi:hypothetical protein
MASAANQAPAVRVSCANGSENGVIGRHRPDGQVLLRANFGVTDLVAKLPISAFGTLRPRVQIPPSRPGQRVFLLSTGTVRPRTDHKRCGL